MENIRKVDIYEYMPILRELIDQGKEVRFLITGSSMAPFLCHERDSIIISKPTKALKKGDMVFYTRKTGQYVMHRIHHIDSNGKIYCIGDAQSDIEGPLDSSCVFGIIHKVIRKGKLMDESNFWWKFFEKVWIRIIPLRPFLIRLVSFIR
ncbi:MAG: S24/S26 family peptidase [Traorella sp.]